MADLEKTVRILFGGDTSDLDRALSSITREWANFDNMGQSVQRATQPFADLTDKILKVDAALVAMVAGGMYLALKSSAEFNQQFALISTSVDATGKDLQAYRDDIIAYSTTSVKSTSDINAALYTAAQAGVKWGESLDFIGKAEQLAVANNANLNTTVDLLTGTMNAYGFTLKDVAHINDVFFESTLIGKQTIDSLGQSMGLVVGIAATSGVSFEQLSAAIATLTAKGLDTAEAITAVKSVITTIISPSKEAEKAAASMGLTFSASTLQSKGLQEMLREVMVATGGSADKMTTLFNEVRAMNGAFMLTNDSMKFFNDALDKINNSTGVAEAAYQKMVATFSNQTQMLKNTFTALLVEIGSRIEPVAAQVTSGIGAVVSAFGAGFKAGDFDPLFSFLAEVAAKVGATLQTIAKNLPEALKDLNFDNLINSLRGLGGALGDAFAALFGDIDLSTVQGLHEWIQKIIDSFTALINVTKGIIEGMKPLFLAIGEIIDQFGGMDSSTAELVGNLLGAAKAINVLAENLPALTGALSTIALSGFLNAATSIIGMVKAIDMALPAITTITGALGIMAGAAGALGVGWMIGSWLNQNKAVQDAAQSMFGLLDVTGTYFGALGKTKAEMDEVDKRYEEAVKKHAALAAAHKETGTAIDVFTGKVKTQRDGLVMDGDTLETVTAKIKAMTVDLTKMPDGKSVTITAQADEGSVDKAWGMIIKKFPDGSTRITQAEVTADQSKLDETKKKIDDTIPAEKKMEIQATIDIAKIKAQAEIVQTAIEWKAKIDIAEIEAATERIKAAFSSVDNAITSTGQTISALVGAIANMNSSSQSWDIVAILEREMKLREDTFELQKGLVAAEIAEIAARTKLYEKGEALIKIESAGLQPELEAFMFKILSAIQIRANAEGMKFLVGV